MSFRNIVDAAQRLAICELLQQDLGFSHNESVIKLALGMAGHNIGSDLVRNHINWLEEQGLVTVDRALPNTWVVRLTERGEDAALGRVRIEGVARPRP